MTALMGIATRLKLARLIHILPDEPDAAGALARASYAGGADAVMLDEDLADVITDDTAAVGLDAITEAARATQGLTAYFGRPVRAAALSPDLFVLADDEADPARTRRLVGEWTMIGRRCNSTEETEAALAHPDVDFLMVGPGLPLIRHAAEVAPAHDPKSKPWFAVGGITIESLPAVIRGGAMRAAVGGAITRASNPEAAAMALKDILREAWNADERMEDVTSSAFGTSPKLTFGKPPVPPSGGRHL
ncbi:MAG: thiamine phosphate synthase [Propionibacteriaceae bacterium]|nr:thiamine phosphate synthase [Propionibacteriaceae bacterium]